MVLLTIVNGAYLEKKKKKKIMGDEAPRGWGRICWNVLMACSVAASSIASLWVLWNKLGVVGPVLFVLFLLAVFVSNRFMKRAK